MEVPITIAANTRRVSVIHNYLKGDDYIIPPHLRCYLLKGTKAALAIDLYFSPNLIKSLFLF
jgi:hypothetical protein